MDILHVLRSTIIAAFFSLPLLLISYTAFLATALGTPGLFILLLGQLLLSVTTFGFHTLETMIEMLPVVGPMVKPFMTVTADRAALLQGSTTGTPINVFPSYWMVHVVFFLSYLLANAVGVYKADAKAGSADWKVSNRRSKAIAVMIVISIIMISLVGARYFLTGTETLVGVALGLCLIPVGFGWYELAKTCGARDSDIFGIIQQMTPNGGAPTTCVYTPIA
jgi:hypothetical protein